MNETVRTRNDVLYLNPGNPGSRWFTLPVTAALLKIDSPDEITAERYTLEERAE